jgi:hypothetical protein
MLVKNATMALCTALAFVSFTSATPAAAAGNPIAIQQCFVTEPKAMSKVASGTQIDYTNQGTKTAKHITFAVAYRNSSEHFLRKVIDTGSFAPGSPIVHHFNLYNDVTYGGKAVQSCKAIKVVWDDGSIWTI